MRAVVCRSFGPPEDLEIEDLPDPIPAAGQALIDVYSAGLNFPDVLQVAGKYQFQPPFPFTPGCEVAGVVCGLGEGVATLRVGQRVMALNAIGGMAETVAVDANAVTPIPDSMSFDVASGFGLVYGTSYHALKQRAAIQPGETLLVLGAGGGVGLAAVEIGKALGARVIAAASTDPKLEVARAHGADELLNYADGNLKDKIRALTGGRGADVIYDPVGGELFDQATRSIAWNGRLLVVGFASGVIPKFPTNLALLKGCQIVGVFWGEFCKREPDANRQNGAELFELYRQGHLQPHVSQAFPIEEYAAALNTFVNRTAVGKVVLHIRDE
jgi:NADPH2:quinone reductase